ncbi:MAG: hypothetical protein Q7S28_03125, partial [bacterium]|nr:hypothetical protein [bacterium]
LHEEHHKNVQWIAGMETNRKCPFACTFCSWPMGKPVLRPIEQVFQMLDNAILKYRAGYVFIFDANFGIFRERDLAIAEHIVKLKREHGLPRSANVQDGKNVEEWVYKIRKTLITGGIDSPAIIALQSIHPPTLKAIKRTNIKTESYKVNQARFASENIPTMTDLILALPEETLESFKFGVGEIMSWGQHDRIHFNNLSMTPDAEVTHRDQRRDHGIETVWINVENMHGVIGEKEEVQEYEELAIATKALPREDWIRMRAFGWMTNFLHMNKFVQIPNVICHTAGKDSQGESPRYDKLIDLFMSNTLDPKKFPLLVEIRDYFIECARKIQRGEGQYSPAPEWLDIFWPSDEYMMIKLVRENNLHGFYAEAEQLLADNIVIDRKLLHQAFQLGHSLLKLPFRTGEHIVKCDWNVLEVYRGARTGQAVELTPGEHKYRIDWSSDSWDTWEDWYKKVVWFCNRSGNYFLKQNAVAAEPVPAGHY